VTAVGRRAIRRRSAAPRLAISSSTTLCRFMEPVIPDLREAPRREAYASLLAMQHGTNLKSPRSWVHSKTQLLLPWRIS
jgi:hypothetical protein